MEKKKVLLVAVPNASKFLQSEWAKSSTYPAVPLLLVGTILKNAGYEVHFIDGAMKENWKEEVRRTLSEDFCYVGTTVMTSQVEHALNLSSIVKKKNAEIPLVWGGIHPTLFSEQTVQHPLIDIVIVDEGAWAGVELAEALNGRRRLEDVDGIIFKRDGKVVKTRPRQPEDVNKFPLLDFSFVDYDTYASNCFFSYIAKRADGVNHRTLPIVCGMGCPHSCGFCVNTAMNRKKYRTLDVEIMLNQIETLQKLYDVNTFTFIDDNFCQSRSRIENFLDGIEERGLKIFWARVCARVDYFNERHLDQRLLERMYELGLRNMLIGVESASPRILDYFNKKTEPEDAERMARYLSSTRIDAALTYIIGAPRESPQETAATFRLAKHIQDIYKKGHTEIFMFWPYPGTPLTNQLVEEGHIKLPKRLEGWSSVLLPVEGFFKTDNLPWIIKNRKFYNIAFFYFKLAIGDVMVSTRFLGPFTGPLRHILKSIAAFRLKNSIFLFPIEYYIFRFAFRFIPGLSRRLLNYMFIEKRGATNIH